MGIRKEHTMSFLLDAIVVIIIGLCFLLGWKRGAAITLLKFVALVAAFTVAVLLSPVLSNAIYETFFKNGVTENVANTINDTLGKGAESIVTSVLTVIPSFASMFFDSVSFSDSAISGLISGENQETINSAASMVERMVAPAFTSLIGIIIMLILFFILLAIFRFFARVLSKMFELPVLSTINRLFGGVIGIAQGVLLVIVLASIIKLAMPLMGGNVPVFSEANIEGSFLFNAFYSGQILESIVNMFV